MKRLLLASAGLLVVALMAAPAQAHGPYSPWGFGNARANHARHHDDLAHRAFHRELAHREAHRYPMTHRQHARLHDHLEHEAFHDHLEHRAAHRSGAYYAPRYGHRHVPHHRVYRSPGVGVGFWSPGLSVRIGR
jgi:hypothetical protein